MKAKTQLTLEDILLRVDEETLFRHYSEFETIEKKFCCPVHKERTPSCKVFENNPLMYKCFGCGSTGTIMQLICIKYNCTYNEAIQIIANDFNITNYFVQKNQAALVLQENHIKTVKNTLIQVRYINWTTELLNYWKDYSISLKSLNKYHIKPIDYYWINYNRFKTNFGFAYQINDKFKILQPNEEEFKWTSNCKIDNIQGFMQLKHAAKLIITSSLKDVACLNENYNLECIAPSSENSFLPDKRVKWLKENYDEIIVYFNNDKAGIKASKEYQEKYGFNYIVNPQGLSKDPSDCFKNNQKTQLTEFLTINNIIK